MSEMADRNATEGGAAHPMARMHMGIAESGKLHALEGRHELALKYYRAAIKIAVDAKDPEIFFRHYLDCIMESLEHTGDFDHVLAYCDRAIELYAEKPPPNPVATMDLATIHQRRAVILMKKGQHAEARGAMRSALEVARRADGKLPFAQTMLRWLDAGFSVDTARIAAEQRRSEYFNVRRETVDPRRAIELSDEEKRAFGIA